MQSYNLSTVIDPTSGLPPQVSPLLRVYLTQNSQTSLQLPSVVFDGFSNVYRFTPPATSLLVTPVPNGTPLCSTDPLINPSSPVVGCPDDLEYAFSPPYYYTSMQLTNSGPSSPGRHSSRDSTPRNLRSSPSTPPLTRRISYRSTSNSLSCLLRPARRPSSARPPRQRSWLR